MSDFWLSLTTASSLEFDFALSHPVKLRVEAVATLQALAVEVEVPADFLGVVVPHFSALKSIHKEFLPLQSQVLKLLHLLKLLKIHPFYCI